MNLSPHFTLEEMIRSKVAEEMGWRNQPGQIEIECMINLCNNLLEPLRRLLGKPIHVTSGYRNAILNKKVGGAKNSQHVRGQAVDIHVDGMTTQELFDFVIASGLVFDQIIQEFDNWVHLSFRPKGVGMQQRMVSMYAVKSKHGKTLYVNRVKHDKAA